MYRTSPMIRIQLHLTDDQDRKLKALARARGRTRAGLIHEAIELLFRGGEASRDPLLELIGAADRVGRADVSPR